MKTIIVLSLPLMLSGCFFVYLPGSVTTAMVDAAKGEHGNYCVSENVTVGQQLPLPNGAIGTVKKIEGKSWRCKNARTPNRAEIEA